MGAFKEDVELSKKAEVFYAASGALFDCNGAYGGKVDHAIGLSMSPHERVVARAVVECKHGSQWAKG